MGYEVIEMIAPFFVMFYVNTEKIPSRAADKILGTNIVADLRSAAGIGKSEISICFPKPIGIGLGEIPKSFLTFGKGFLGDCLFSDICLAND
jgi:hypothetical protein